MVDTVSQRHVIARASTILVGLFFAGALAAAPPPDVAPRQIRGLDTGFVHQAMEFNSAGVELGQIAVQRAANDNVRSFAEQMIDAHRKDKDKLAEVAAKKGITAPTELSAKHQALRTRLTGASGIAFDRDYMKAMVDDHRKAVKLYQREAKQGQDKELRELAQSQLKGLQSHLKSAQDIQKRLQVGKQSEFPQKGK